MLYSVSCVHEHACLNHTALWCTYTSAFCTQISHLVKAYDRRWKLHVRKIYYTLKYDSNTVHVLNLLYPKIQGLFKALWRNSRTFQDCVKHVFVAEINQSIHLNLGPICWVKLTLKPSNLCCRAIPKVGIEWMNEWMNAVLVW